jgi:hypothetical protein
LRAAGRAFGVGTACFAGAEVACFAGAACFAGEDADFFAGAETGFFSSEAAASAEHAKASVRAADIRVDKPVDRNALVRTDGVTAFLRLRINC